MATTQQTQLVTGYEHGDAWDSGYLSVDSIHSIYYEQYGPKEGKPALVLHGGPGGATSKKDTIFFDPAVYRVVIFDQRGAGKSLPPAELRDNTSQHLVSDIEQLREHCGIAKWHVVFGGSWGSTLALLYAQAHPSAVGSLVLRGIFTIRKAEVAFTRGANGTAHTFPEAYEDFISHLPPDQRADPTKAYHKLLTSDDRQTQIAAARVWNKWELSIGTLFEDTDGFSKLDDETWSLAHARLEMHYEMNGGFIEDGQILKPKSIDKIKHIPCSIVQGRYDMVCPPNTAWDLHKALPDSKIYFIPDAGHSVKEPGIRRKLIEICDEYVDL